MRILMWFTLGFGAACALCAYILPSDLFLYGCAAGILCVAACLPLLRKISAARIYLAVFLGITVAVAWNLVLHHNYLKGAIALDGNVRESVITVSEYPVATDFGCRVEGTVSCTDRTYSVQAYLDEDVVLTPGDQITGTFYFRYTGPQGKNNTWLLGNGIYLTASAKEDIAYSAGVTALHHQGAIWRHSILQMIQTLFPEDTAPLAKALLLGYTEDLSYETDTHFKVSGIRHVIAVSGLHVSVLYGFIMAVTGKKRFLAALLGIPSLLLFAAVTGFTPSVVRACVMVGMMLLADLIGREYDSATALSAACLLMLLKNPFVIFSVSFQLSVGCVAGILLFSSPLQGWITEKLSTGKKKPPRIVHWIAAGVSVTLGAMSLTTPLSALYFGSVSLIGLVTNLLTLWLISLIFIGIILAVVLGLIAGSVGGFLAWALSWPMRLVMLAARGASLMPLAAVYTASPYIAFWIVFVYLLLAVRFFFRKSDPMMLIFSAALGLFLAVGCSWAEPLTHECTVTAIDVGQGQSVLIQSEGKNYLIDCGGDSDTAAADKVANKLLSQGIRKLDAVILTHCDADHAGGLPYLLTRVDTAALFIPSAEAGYVPPKTKATVIWVDREIQISGKSSLMRIIPPISGNRDNEKSLCILFETENCDILITGDRSAAGERMLMKQCELPEVDLLIAGHHGSKYSTCLEFLYTVRPENVFISVGADNVFGHPAEEMLARLRSFDCNIYRTDQHGTIVYRR